MQTWQTPMITIRAESDVKDGILDLECESAALHATPDVPSERQSTSDTGKLIVSGVNPAPLQSLSWAPRQVNFSAVGAIEPREFRVRSFEIGEDGTSVAFILD